MDSKVQQTLGCDCESPAPKSPGSALCSDCGLIYMTSEQYSEHLARCRAEVAELLATPTDQPREAQQGESRGWFKRRRSAVAAPAA